MAIQRTLEMDFATELGKTQRIRVYDAKETLTDAEVAAAMDSIVTTSIFTGSGGNITGKIAARIVSKETSELNLV